MKTVNKENKEPGVVVRSGNYLLELERESSARKLNWKKLCAFLMIIFASTSILVAIPHPAAATFVNQSSSSDQSAANAASPVLVANFTFSPTAPSIDENVNFDASSSYSPGSYISSYQWSWGDGSFPTGGLIGSYPRTTTHQFQLNGTFTVTLAITDGNGRSATISHDITVSMISSNTPPAALFSYTPSYPLANQTVTFDASISRDPDGDPVTEYNWTGGALVAGGITPGTQFTGSGVSFPHIFSKIGLYLISLSVTDDHQLSSSQYTIVAVTRIPYLPGVRAGDYGKYYFSTNQTSNSGLLAVSINVTQVAGTKVGSSFGVQSPNGTIFFAANQTIDVYSGLGLGSFFITVIAANLAAGDPVFADFPFLFNSTTTEVLAGASREVNILTFSSPSAATTFEFDRLTGLLVHLALESSGQRTEIFLGDTNAWPATGNEAPLPLFYWSPDNPNPGQPVSFDASRSYDPDRDSPLSYAWTFGDGGTASGASASHTYTARGNYTVTLTVSDPGGASTSASKAIMVGRYVPGSISIVDDGVCVDDTTCRFVPSLRTVSPGALVIWANNGVLTHSVYSCSAQFSPTTTECPVMNDPALPSFYQPSIPPGGTFSQTLAAPGTYYYYCAIHPWMHGTVIVTAAPAITSVSSITTDTHGTITILGSGFGNTLPQVQNNGDGSIDTIESSTTPSIAIMDSFTQTGGWNWQAGHQGNAIGIFLASWSDTKIVINGFGSALGPGTRDSSGHCTGSSPWAICVGDPITVEVWGPNNSGIAYYYLTVSSQQAETVVKTIEVVQYPTYVGVNSATNRIYVANAAQMSVIDGSTDTVVATLPVGGSIGVDSQTNRVYVNDDNNMTWVIDGSTNTVLTSVPVGGFYPGGVGVNPVTNKIYIAYGSGVCCNPDNYKLAVLDGSTNTVVATIPVGFQPVGVAVNSATNRIYVANSLECYSGYSGCRVSVIDGSTNTLVANATVANNPNGIDLNGVTNAIYISGSNANAVYVIDGSDNTVVATVPVGISPSGVGVNSVTNRIYVANYGSNTTSVIDGSTNNVVATVSVGTNPWGVGVNAVTNKIYVTNYGSGSVSVISAQVRTTSTSASCSPSTVGVGASSTCTATVTDTAAGPTPPSGTVSFASDSSGSFSGSPCTLSGSGSSATCQATYTPSAVDSGTHTITATYSGDSDHGGSLGSASVTVTPTSASDFHISASPSSIRIPQGYTNNTSIIVTGTGGFAGTVSISVTGMPPASLWSNPSSVTLTTDGTASINLNENLPSYAPVGNYTIIVTGTRGSITHSVAIPVRVVAADSLPGFRLSITPVSPTVPQGSSGTAYVVLKSLNGYSGTVNLQSAFSTLPTTFGSNSVYLPSGATVNTTLTISPGSTSPGTYSIYVEGFTVNPPNNGPYDSTSASVVVTPISVFDFSLSTPSPSSLAVVQGSTSPSASIDATLTSGATAPVTFSTSGLPAGVTASFTNNPCSPTCSVSVSFSATATATLGTTTITINASGGGASHSTSLSLTVSAPAVFNFSLGLPSPGSLTVVEGSTSASSSIIATLVSGTATPVTFSASGLPSGVTAMFTNNPCSPGCTVTVSFSATATSTTGTSTITIRASSGGTSRSTSLSLTVQPSFDYSLSVNPGGASLVAGSSITATVKAILTGGAAEPVALMISVSPNPSVCQSTSGSSPCGTITFYPTSVTPSSAGAASTLTISTTPIVPPGTYTITITGSPTGASSASAAFTLTVTAAPVSTVGCAHDTSCSVQSNSTLSKVRFAGNTIHFEADGSPGTLGYANVAVPKSNIPNINELHVFVDNVKLASSSVSITSNSTDYFIYFTFTFHSPVQVDIQLAAPQPTTGGLTVTVKDSNGNPVSGATVTLTSGPYDQTLPGAITTGADGTATFNNLLPGSYNYQASAAGYSGTITVTTTVTDGQVQTSSATLSKVQPVPPSPTDYTLVYIGAGIAAIIVLAGVFLVLRRKRGPVRVTT